MKKILRRCCAALAVLLTLAAAVIMRRLGERFPRLNQWTIGVYRKK